MFFSSRTILFANCLWWWRYILVNHTQVLTNAHGNQLQEQLTAQWNRGKWVKHTWAGSVLAGRPWLDAWGKDGRRVPPGRLGLANAMETRVCLPCEPAECAPECPGAAAHSPPAARSPRSNAASLHGEGKWKLWGMGDGNGGERGSEENQGGETMRVITGASGMEICRSRHVYDRNEFGM